MTRKELCKRLKKMGNREFLMCQYLIRFFPKIMFSSQISSIYDLFRELKNSGYFEVEHIGDMEYICGQNYGDGEIVDFIEIYRKLGFKL